MNIISPSRSTSLSEGAEFFQIAISTMDGFLNDSALSNLGKIIIINQGAPHSISGATIVNMDEVGLSRSRNRGVEELVRSGASIGLISDNDVTYMDDIERVITEAFLEHPDADIITFMAVTNCGKPFSRSYRNSVFKHSWISVAGVSSIEIAFRPRRIAEAQVRFDERFGLGAVFPAGEEFIFLSDALRRGLSVIHYPKVIVVHPAASSGADYFRNESLASAKGAVFARVFGRFCYFICLAFAVRKFRNTGFGLIKYLNLMFLGVRKYARI
jgi:hypothetical protein